MKMNSSFHSRQVLGISLLFLLALPLTAHSATITQFSYDLATISEVDLLNDWTKNGTGTRTGIQFTTTGDTLTYTRNDIPIAGSQAWMFEAVLSAQGVGAADERGARFWTSFTDSDAPAFPPGDKFRQLEIRLEEAGGGQRRFALVDGQDGTEKASILGNWADAGNRFRVRLRRQLVGTDDLIFLEAQLADVALGSAWFSESVLLSAFGFQPGVSNEFGFGNVVPAAYGSAWESVTLMASDMPDTLLPSAVPVPPAVWLFGSGLLGLLGVARRKAGETFSAEK